MHQLDQALVQISKVFSDITGTTEYFDKIQNSRYFENKQHYENLFRLNYGHHQEMNGDDDVADIYNHIVK